MLAFRAVYASSLFTSQAFFSTANTVHSSKMVPLLRNVPRRQPSGTTQQLSNPQLRVAENVREAFEFMAKKPIKADVRPRRHS